MSEKVPMVPKEKQNPEEPSAELYDKRSLIYNDDDRIVYLFNYFKDTPENSRQKEIINREVLKEMKDKHQWKLIKHPLVLNYVNEKILGCSLFYTVHILAYFVLLLLIYSYIYVYQLFFRDLLVTFLVIVFFFFMIVKCVLKLQDTDYKNVSLWFYISYLFNLLALINTTLFVWTPYTFKFDNYHQESKRTIEWALSIITIITSWVNCLYILRKAPCGAYILMLIEIFKSFLKTAIIWIPTIFCFAFSFQLVMKDSGTKPWVDWEMKNTSIPNIIMPMFQSFTKTLSMMIGEVQADDILSINAYIANALLILFEIITVIILTNLMVSLAVGEVSELRASAEERLLKIKVNFCIEALHLSKYLPSTTALHKTQTNNVLVVDKHSGKMFTTNFSDEQLSKESWDGFFRRRQTSNNAEQIYNLVLNASDITMTERDDLNRANSNRAILMSIQNATVRLIEPCNSGIASIVFSDDKTKLKALKDNEKCYRKTWRKYQRWLIGLNWKALLLSSEK